MTDAIAPTVHLTRWIKASPQRVFEAWTTADQLARWLSPGPEHPLAEVVADARVGGELRLAYGTADAGRYDAVVGQFLELTPPQRLVFTWAWQSPHSEFAAEDLGHESTVTIDLLPIDGGTELTLRHRGLPPGLMSERHTWGWTGALDQLADFDFSA
ncbi:MAG: SRPBCC domain-containing protein [Planctomycetota bacterium]